MLYGTLEKQSFDIKNPYLLQGTQHITDISENMRKGTIIGHLMTSRLVKTIEMTKSEFMTSKAFVFSTCGKINYISQLPLLCYC